MTQSVNCEPKELSIYDDSINIGESIVPEDGDLEGNVINSTFGLEQKLLTIIIILNL
ncbi:MAG TPA: hypothetical protein VFP49_07100 [Nitrososphaeraceae archaeon]|nr:hypothetical protein [Nitrososphaeraceae archaeon]